MSSFEGERDAVADAARMGDLDGLADVKGEVRRRNQPSQSSPACSATGTSLARKAMICMWRV